MKIFVFCLSVLMLALTTTALPLTGAGGIIKGGPDHREAVEAAPSPTVGLSLRDGHQAGLSLRDGHQAGLSLQDTHPDPARRPPHDAADSIHLAQARPAQDNRPRTAPPNVQDPAKAAKDPTSNAAAAKAKRVVPITAEMESEVDKFVREHHRELADVLAHLKANVPKEYERAVRDLNRNRLRLQQLEGRDRYATELKLWKAESRARLLGARVQMGDAEGSRESLRQKLAEIYDLRASLLQRDRDRTAERLKKLDEQIEALRNQRDEHLEKQLLALTKSTQKRGKSVTTSARKAKPESSKQAPVKKPSGKTIQ